MGHTEPGMDGQWDMQLTCLSISPGKKRLLSVVVVCPWGGCVYTHVGMSGSQGAEESQQNVQNREGDKKVEDRVNRTREKWKTRDTVQQER